MQPAVKPYMKTDPFDHQLSEWEWSKDRTHYGFLYEQGCGKSKVLVDTITWLYLNGKIDRAVIFSPKSMVGSWARQQFPEHLADGINTFILRWESSDSKKWNKIINDFLNFKGLKILIAGIDSILTKRLDAFLDIYLGKTSLFAIDESTCVKNYRAKRAKVAERFAKRCGYRRILTGTPVANNPLDIFQQFQILEPGCLGFSSFVAFRSRFAIMTPHFMHGRRVDLVVGYRQLDDLWTRIKRHSGRILKKDCLDLPDKIYETKFLQMPDEMRKFYVQMRDKALMELSNDTTASATIALTRILRMRQIMAGFVTDDSHNTVELGSPDAKLDACWDVFEESNGKLLIWCNFIHTVHKVGDYFSKELGAEFVGKFYGDVSAQDRQNLIESFQRPDGHKVLVLQHRTGGFGITLTTGNTNVYYDNDLSLETRLQSEDRTHRIGQAKNVLYVDLVYENSLDEWALNIIKNKSELAKMTLNELKTVIENS